MNKKILVYPSPLGELYFLIKTMFCNAAVDGHVSVPSRGAIFLN